MRLSNKKSTPVLPFFLWLKWADRLYLPLQDRLRPAACPWRRRGYGQRPQVAFIDGVLNARRECEEIPRPALVLRIPAGLSQADAAAVRCRGALGGSLARENHSLQPQRRRDHLQAVFQEQFKPVLRLYHWTETPQQLTQRRREGTNYCPEHLHNYNVFLMHAQYKNCKL